MLLKNVDDHSSVDQKCSENQPDTSAVPSVIIMSENHTITGQQNNEKMNSNSIQTTPDIPITLRKQKCPFDIDISPETTCEDDLYVLEPRPAPHE